MWDALLIHEILSYMVRNKDAKDTFDGIYKWWISKSRTDWDEEMVRGAVNFLISKNWLVVRGANGASKEIYGINGKRFDEMKSFLAELENRASQIVVL